MTFAEPAVPTRRLVIGFSVALMALAALSFLAVGNRSALDWERSITLDVYRWPSWSTPFLEAVMQAGARGAGIVLGVVALAMGRWRLAIAFVLVTFAADLACDALKALIDRPRPSANTLGAVPREAVAANGFPSTHTAIATGLATLVWARLLTTLAWVRLSVPRVILAILAAVPLLTALARLHLGVHWPLDVLGGAAVGVALGCLAALVLRRA